MKWMKLRQFFKQQSFNGADFWERNLFENVQINIMKKKMKKD